MKAGIYQFIKKVSNAGFQLLGLLRTEWTQAGGSVALSAEPAHSIPLPRNAAQLPVPYRDKFGLGVPLPERRVHLLRQVQVSWHGVVFHNLRLFQPSVSATYWMAPEFSGTFLLRQWSGAHVQAFKSEVVGLAHGPWAVNNYYHWMVDTLPRLLLLQRFEPGCRLLLPEPSPDYVRQTAAIFGFNRVLPVPLGTVANVPQLVMPDYPAQSGFQDAVLSLAARDTVLRAFGLELLGGRRIYVSRSRQLRRRLINEADIEPLLRQYGFETVYFEDMNFEEQVRLMAQTSVLVGMHGANLTNMMFMPLQATVVEITMGTRPILFNPCYYYLADSMQLVYYNVPCRDNPSDAEHENHPELYVEYAALASVFADLFPLEQSL